MRGRSSVITDFCLASGATEAEQEQSLLPRGLSSSHDIGPPSTVHVLNFAMIRMIMNRIQSSSRLLHQQSAELRHAWASSRARARARRTRGSAWTPDGQASEKLTSSEHLHVAHRRAQQLLVVGYCSIHDGRSTDGQRWCALAQCVSSTVLCEQLLQLLAGRPARG